MAIERRRRCGYRKVGGLYLVSDGLSEPCHRLPFPLHVCPACGAGVKQSRGWVWVNGDALSGGPCPTPGSCHAGAFGCALCRGELGRCGLLWVGARFYPSPHDFAVEADALGVSKRLATVPRGLVLGETWVLLAHPLAAPEPVGAAVHEGRDAEQAALALAAGQLGPGVFRAFRPTRVELLITTTEATPERLAELTARGITPVVVPDHDPDHQGSVYDGGNGRDPADVGEG